MKPSVGRIVHYVSYGTPGGEYTSQCRAAVITAVNESRDTSFPDVTHILGVSLTVLNPEGMFFNQQVPFNEDEKRGGTWHWPERIDE